MQGVPLPPAALIIGDLFCGKCGYNLRGNTVGGRCPECSYGVSSTLLDLTQPALADEALVSFGRWYLALILAALGSCLAIVAGLFFTFASAAARFLDLRKIQANVRDSALLRERLTMAVAGTALEAGCSGGATIIAIAALYGYVDQAIVNFAGLATVGMVLVNFFVSALFLLGLAARYDNARVRWELLAALALAALTGVGSAASLAIIGVVGVGAALVPFGLASFLVWLASEQLVQLAAFHTSLPTDVIEPLGSALERQEAAIDSEELKAIPLVDPDEHEQHP